MTSEAQSFSAGGQVRTARREWNAAQNVHSLRPCEGAGRGEVNGVRVLDPQSGKSGLTQALAGEPVRYSIAGMTNTQKNAGVTLWLVAMTPGVSDVIERAPLGERLGRDRMFPKLAQAIAGYSARGSHVPKRDVTAEVR